MSKQHDETPEIEEIEPEGKSWKERGKLVLFGAMMSLGIFSAVAGLPIPAVVGLFAGMYIAANYKGEDELRLPNQKTMVRKKAAQPSHAYEEPEHHSWFHSSSGHNEDKSWVKATERSQHDSHHER